MPFKILISVIKRQFSLFTEKRPQRQQQFKLPSRFAIVPILQEQPLTLSLCPCCPQPLSLSYERGCSMHGRNFGGRFSDRDFNWKWISASKACHLAVTCAHYCLFLFLLLSCWGLMQNPTSYFVDTHLPL